MRSSGARAVLSADRVQEQLQRILLSPEFHATDQQRSFLQFVITETLAGRNQEIKGYTVATRVFGRKDDFDQATDPIVSIQANKLRRALERYYLVEGLQDPIRIDIPKGAYVPTFREQIGMETEEEAHIGVTRDVLSAETWPAVLVRPFQNLTGDGDKNYLGFGFSSELAAEITRFQEVRVLLRRPEGRERRASDIPVRFAVDGSIRSDHEGFKLAVYLTDTKTGAQLWSDTHRSTFEAAQIISFQEDVARMIAAKIAGEHGVIAKTLSADSKNKPPNELKTYEAILRYYEYDRTLTPESFLRAFEALKIAKDVEPECGQVWTMLGRLYANIYSLEFPGFQTALDKSIAFAEKGIQLNPDNQRARVTLALVRMFSNETAAALVEVERAVALNPKSLCMLDGIGYLMTLLGEWERGPDLFKRIIRLNPFHGLYVHYALWLDYIRQEKYEKAHLETLNFTRPSVFWEPLMKAATFGLLGRVKRGREEVENLLRLKPDFSRRGRVLIGHYIKFDDIAERMIEGLRKSGLHVE